ESVAMVTIPADVVRLPQHTTYSSASNTCSLTTYDAFGSVFIEIRDRRRVPRARPNHQLQPDEQPTTTSKKKISWTKGASIRQHSDDNMSYLEQPDYVIQWRQIDACSLKD
ncbi:hypothetical protein Tco_1514201, partial [Tanacetum coccineum]